MAEIKASGMIPDGGTILELGTGYCYDHWALFGEGYRFIPSDINAFGRDDIEFMDAEDIPRDKYLELDAILAIELLEHVKRPLKVLRDCSRHLKPSGIMVVTVPFSFKWHTGSVVTDYHRFTPDGLALLFGRAGYGRYFTDARYLETDEELKPSWVVGWAQREQIIGEWKVDVPQNWRQLQMQAEHRWKERDMAL